MKPAGHHSSLPPTVVSHPTRNSYFTPYLSKTYFNIIISASYSHARSHTVEQVGLAVPGSDLVSSIGYSDIFVVHPKVSTIVFFSP
jgi:hypothetical protein